MSSLNRAVSDLKRGTLPCSIYLLLLIPLVLFVVSLQVRPTINFDSGSGFLVLRSMLAGGRFNDAITPDPANIANDISTYQTWWSPGQYLVPGIFVWCGASYGVAVCLTALICTLTGALGWAKVAQRFAVTPFVLFWFVFGLVTFRYTTLAFRIYNGGETLLFAAAPWCFLWLRDAAERSPLACFTISLLAAIVLFFAKLTGLIVFAADVVAIGLFQIVQQRRITKAAIAMATAAAVAALLLFAFWLARGRVPAQGDALSITGPALLMPLAATAFSGVSGLNLLDWLLMRPSAPILSDFNMASYVLGPLGLFVMVLTWRRLRNTGYRPMAILLFAIMALYAATLAASYLRGSHISYDERHFRYVGILFFLLALVALDRGCGPAGRILAPFAVAFFGLYGVASYAVDVKETIARHSFDRQSGLTQEIVAPAALDYLRSQMAEHDWQRAIAVLPTPRVIVALPRYRIIVAPQLATASIDSIAARQWSGRAEKIFVMVEGQRQGDAKVAALLKSFVAYGQDKWERVVIDGTTIYSQ